MAALTLHTNVTSLVAQNNLTKSSSSMSRSLQRLSSGLRINSAQDDAAGMAISDRMTSQIRTQNLAIRNANDGISVSQVAEGALQEMTNILQRVRELAVQAANTVNTGEDRDSLGSEVTELLDEFNRIAGQTGYNGVKVLTGAFDGNFLVSTDVEQNISLKIPDVRGNQVGVGSTFDDVNDTSLSGFLDYMGGMNEQPMSGSTINNIKISDVTVAEAHNNSQIKVDAINAKTSQTGVTAFSMGNGAIGDNIALPAAMGEGEFAINGVSINAASTAADLVLEINEKTADHGVTAKIDFFSNKLILGNKSGKGIHVQAFTPTARTLSGFANRDTMVKPGQNGVIILNTDFDQTKVTFDGAATGMSITGIPFTSINVGQEPVADINISTTYYANLAVVTATEGINHLNTLRGKLGATQNRLESTIANLSNITENLTAARSRVRDTDIAAESAILTKNSILQQASTAILSQANQLPQIALQLLG